MIVSKEHLVRTMRHAYGTVPFLPVTYDLSYPEQLEGFVADYACRSERNGQNESEQGGTARSLSLKLKDCLLEDETDLDVNSGECRSMASNGGNTRAAVDNIWIMKRYRGRQSMDYPISDSLPCLLRHLESAPRLASKYVSNPMLYKNRKFDLRYYVIVLSLKPLRIFRHKMFVVRVANETYSHGDLELYQKHFTVMNFLDDNSNCEEDSVRCIRGTGGKENPTSDQFVDHYNAECLMSKVTDGGEGAADMSRVDDHDNDHDGDDGNSIAGKEVNTDTHRESVTAAQPRTHTDASTHPHSSSSSGVGHSASRGPVAEDAWSSEVQSGIDSALRLLFSGVSLAFKDEPPHPSGSSLHPNAGETMTPC
jgi:Tubulin-tyrosine ligase family